MLGQDLFHLTKPDQTYTLNNLIQNLNFFTTMNTHPFHPKKSFCVNNYLEMKIQEGGGRRGPAWASSSPKFVSQAKSYQVSISSIFLRFCYAKHPPSPK